jgi:hypothetical protein
MKEEKTWETAYHTRECYRQRTWITRHSLYLLFPYKCIPPRFRKGWWNITFNEYFNVSSNTRPCVFILFHLRVCFPSFFFFFSSSLLDVSKLKCLMVECSRFHKTVDSVPGKCPFFSLFPHELHSVCLHTLYIGR